MLLDNPYNRDWRVENEINCLINSGYKVHLICTEGTLEEKHVEKEGLIIDRIITNKLYQPLRKAYKENEKEVINFIIKLNPDVIHCHDFRMLLIGAKIKRLKPSVNFIFDSHEYLPGYPYYKRIPKKLNRFKGKFIWKYYLYNHDKIMPLVDHVISVSQPICDKFETRYCKQWHLIRNMPDKIKLAKRNDRYFNTKYNIPNNHKIIVHTGNTHFNLDRFETLTKTINHFKNISLIFLGSQTSIVPMKKFIKENNIKSVYFHENIPRSEITYYCSQADIGLVYFWNPEWESYDFAMPNKLLDTSLAGLPIISTNQTGLRLFSEKHKHMVLFSGDDKESLSEAIYKMLDNYKQLKFNAEKVAQNVNWGKESKVLTNLYSSIQN